MDALEPIISGIVIRVTSPLEEGVLLLENGSLRLRSLSGTHKMPFYSTSIPAWRSIHWNDQSNEKEKRKTLGDDDLCQRL